MLIRILFWICALSTLLGEQDAEAWGRRGHSLIAANAAYLVAKPDEQGQMLKSRSFDLGYFANVPDIVWKKPGTYQKEFYNHFMDFEIFDREIPAAELDAQLKLSRKEFEAKYPSVDKKAGRSFWRVREFVADLEEASAKLREPNLSVEERHARQAKWLTIAGTLGHYVGDLSQPLHCSENYDGEKTNQKGIHSFFEDTMVDALYPKIEWEAFEYAKKRWAKFHKENGKKTTLELLEALGRSSRNRVDALLLTDRKAGRENLEKAAKAHHQMLVERLGLGSLYLAEIWSRHMDWPVDNKRFYDFEPKPDYVDAD